MIIVKILTLFLLTTFASWTQAQYEGDTCTKDGVQGVCTMLRKCKQAIADLRIGKRPQNCSFMGSAAIVCCIQSAAPTAVQTCPAIPEKHIKVKKNGQKAWDKCIDWIEYVMPCTSGGALLLGQPQVRTDRCAHNVAPLIVGGTKAALNEFPHMALLGYDNPQTGQVVWSCGGTLISERWVMTAAHCLYNREVDSDVKYVRLGSLDRGAAANPDLEFTISEMKSHPDYKGIYPYYDIALLQLNKNAKLSAAVIPACLHTGNRINDAKMLASGWGDTTAGGESSKQLLKVTLEKFSHSECSSKNPVNRKSPRGVDDAIQICAGHHTEAKDSCQGDSGGPLQIYNTDVYCMYTIVGITSTGKGCGEIGQPAIYTRVSAFIPWIEQHVWP